MVRTSQRNDVVDAPVSEWRTANDLDAVEEELGVLIVDDEPAVLRNLADGLALLDFEVSTAASAAEASVRLAEDPRIGVMLTDIRMPGRDGLGLAQEILADRLSAPPVQVILMTGHATLDDATLALRAGVRDMLRKPFRLAEAEAAVTAALKAARADRAALRRRAAEARRIEELEASRRELSQRLQDILGQHAALEARRPAQIQNELMAVSHALRTPLSIIAGEAEIIGEHARRLIEVSIGNLQHGVQDAIRAVELVEEFCRVRGSAESVPRERVDLVVAAAHAISAATARANERRVALELIGASEPVPIIGKSKVIFSALSHCVAAAVEWVPGGFCVTILIESVSEDGQDWKTVTVLGAGAGAKPPLPAHRAFAQVGSALARPHEELRFFIARTLATQAGGIVTSWCEGRDALAIRLALPA